MEEASRHQHPVSREIAAFLRKIKEIQQDSEAMVYITAVGGVPFSNYIRGHPFDCWNLAIKSLSNARDCRICWKSTESWDISFGHGLHGYHCLGEMSAGWGPCGPRLSPSFSYSWGAHPAGREGCERKHPGCNDWFFYPATHPCAQHLTLPTFHWFSLTISNCS